ncbi:unnamed protein product [Urochloa decumbens]|uniref:KIB1-4 beta-propeller domain-containing protein n=1 Tax=Urochloa decumbens TaxID=240449 RepID=A0ABC8Z7F0_9POAL
MDESTNALAGGRPPLGTLPVLVYDHGLSPNNRRQTAFAIGDQSLHTSFVPELAGNRYHATPHGWVLLVSPAGPSRRARLWDPRSGESVPLPDMDREPPPELWECCLSAAPTAASCVVLVLDKKEPRFLYCRVGDTRWSAHEYDIGDVMLPPEYAPPSKVLIDRAAAVDGKFYFRPNGNRMGVIDFSPAVPEFSYIDFPPQPEFPDGSNICNELLVESRGELYNVYVYLKEFSPEVLTVRVYRIDLSEQAAALSKVDDLGDRAFLLSYSNTQLLCSASKYGVKGNCVYFNHNVMGEADGGLLCIYDLDDKSLKTVRPCPKMTELIRNPFWMLPTDQDSSRG